MGMIRAAVGEWENAVGCLEESIALAERIPYPEAVRSGQGILAEQELLQGKPGAALARVEPLVERSDPEELGVVRLLPLLAWACQEVGNDARAEEVAVGGVERAKAQGHRLAPSAVRLRRHRLAMAGRCVGHGGGWP